MLFMSSKNSDSLSRVIVFSASLFTFISLNGCEFSRSFNYLVKDSTYIWSANEEEYETNSVTTEYRSISQVAKEILKSDVQLIFEAMVNNELPGIEPFNDTGNHELKDNLVPPGLAAEIKIESENDAAIIPVNNEQNEISTAVVQPKPEINQEQIVIKDTIAQNTDNSAQITELNHMTKESPSAGGVPVNQVISDVKIELESVSTTQQLSNLSENIHYQLSANEFGMWQITKHRDRPHNEICSLSSATVQVDSKLYATQVWFDVVGNQLLVNSTTNIDIAKAQVGIKFDNGRIIPFSKNYFNTSAIWEGDLEATLDIYQQIGISIGGDELGRRNQEFVLSLKDLKRAYSEYKACNRGVNVASL